MNEHDNEEIKKQVEAMLLTGGFSKYKAREELRHQLENHDDCEYLQRNQVLLDLINNREPDQIIDELANAFQLLADYNCGENPELAHKFKKFQLVLLKAINDKEWCEQVFREICDKFDREREEREIVEVLETRGSVQLCKVAHTDRDVIYYRVRFTDEKGFWDYMTLDNARSKFEAQVKESEVAK